MSNFKKLIKHFADGRTVCNCGEAYHTNCGRGAAGLGEFGQTLWVDDLPACRHGCSTNQFDAKNEMANRVINLVITQQ
jgi:hypothetical protein